MRLPALISFIDATRCSLDCQLMNLGCCTARGHASDRREILQREGDYYLRTEYCRHKASNSSVIETCPLCEGLCEGETYSAKTTCTKCGSEFVRIQDQDETYLREAKGYLRDNPNVRLE